MIFDQTRILCYYLYDPSQVCQAGVSNRKPAKLVLETSKTDRPLAMDIVIHSNS